MHSLPFAVASEIEFGSLIEKGSFGKVFRGRWREKDVAIKKFKSTVLKGEAEEEFYREASIMYQSNHPCIVKLFAVCVEPEKNCFIMEYLQFSLLDVLQDSKIPLPWVPTRLQIAIDIANGLKFLHSQLVIHRDMKSANVLLNNELRAKICDFGLAKIKAQCDTTKTGLQKIGSARWNAPEIVRGEPRTEASDIYSFGMVLWELEMRKIPYSFEQDTFLIINLIREGRREATPKDSPIAFLIEQCCQDSPNLRPSAESIFAALEMTRQLYKIPSEIQSPQKKVNILSIDGGSGFAAGRVLMEIENRTKKKVKYLSIVTLQICESFDVICGTGVSAILALAVGKLKLSAKDAYELFKQGIKKVRQSKSTFGVLVSSFYDEKCFEEFLRSAFKDSTLSPSSTDPKMFLVAVSSESSGPFLLRNYEPNQISLFNGETGWEAWKAIRASSAMPIYLKPYTENSVEFTGGIKYNNPTNFAIEEVCLITQKPIGESIGLVVSVGCGQTLKSKKLPSGFFSLPSQLHWMILQLTETEDIHEYVEKLCLKHGITYKRLNPMLSKPLEALGDEDKVFEADMNQFFSAMKNTGLIN